MYQSRIINNKINSLHYRAFRMGYNDNVSSFEDLLQKDGSVTLHQQNLPSLTVEIFEVSKNIAPLMSDIFTKNHNFCTDNVSANTRSNSIFYNAHNPRRNYGLNTLRHLGLKVYDMVPEEIKNSSSVQIFKPKIKNWVPPQCPCRLCAKFVSNLGYLN